ncbi:hypothetical protein FIA58_003560 [Flavobacterium jejuense]|uniref:Secreted protein n=1 Tax=Flavobacterium jejuense TaxID=1544455 RepID=A0ABX0IS88_9FLAO|nr:hypothetical protein [Flavobacterium jejuense]NHN24744.1 hypothetical protein [Flavobacterium jejuense]
MKKVILLFVLFSVSLFSQVDKKKQVFNLQLSNPFETNTAPSPSSLPSLQYKSVLDKDENYLKKYSDLNKAKPTKSVLELEDNKKFINLGDEVRDKLNKELAKEGNWEDVFFGKYKVSTPIIKIMTRDFADPDGDKVQIILNNAILVSSIILGTSYKTNYVELREGDNLLDILALNQGLSGPNTATFAIYDDNGNLITINDWSLNTGVSAKFIIEYIKPIEEGK